VEAAKFCDSCTVHSEVEARGPRGGGFGCPIRLSFVSCARSRLPSSVPSEIHIEDPKVQAHNGAQRMEAVAYSSEAVTVTLDRQALFQVGALAHLNEKSVEVNLRITPRNVHSRSSGAVQVLEAAERFQMPMVMNAAGTA
jgi:hypothetical protein